MKIDAKALKQALTTVAERRLGKELREAIIYGPPLLGEILKAYEDALPKSEAVMQGPTAVVCGKCGADRTKEGCRLPNQLRCMFVGEAQ